jgi:hypothetical protein
MLFDPRVHEPVVDADWRAAEAESQIRAIAREADEALRRGDWWPLHPLDDDGATPDVIHDVYFGAAGVLWALHRLAQAGLHEPRHDYGRLAGDVLDGYLARPALDGPAHSVFVGEGGIALVAWLLSPTQAVADRLAEIVTADPGADTLELLYGSPGQLVIAGAMLERTGEQRWASAWTAIADRLMLRWGERVPGFWTQRLFGSTQEILGPAHGLAGIVAALARQPDHVPFDRLVRGVTAAVSATAIREGPQVNWPPALQEGLAKADGSIRTQ